MAIFWIISIKIISAEIVVHIPKRKEKQKVADLRHKLKSATRDIMLHRVIILANIPF